MLVASEAEAPDVSSLEAWGLEARGLEIGAHAKRQTKQPRMDAKRASPGQAGPIEVSDIMTDATDPTDASMIETRVLDLLKTKVTDREIGLESSVVEDTGLDSVSVMDFVMELEDEFDISVPLDQIAEVRTVSDLAGVVSNLTGAS